MCVACRLHRGSRGRALREQVPAWMGCQCGSSEAVPRRYAAQQASGRPLQEPAASASAALQVDLARIAGVLLPRVTTGPAQSLCTLRHLFVRPPAMYPYLQACSKTNQSMRRTPLQHACSVASQPIACYATCVQSYFRTFITDLVTLC